MPSAEKESNDSAQSPACSRNALPSATWARSAVSARASPANTSGGSVCSCLSDASSAASSGQRGCCARSEEHTSELQSLMRISYAVFCLKKKKNKLQTQNQK